MREEAESGKAHDYPNGSDQRDWDPKEDTRSNDGKHTAQRVQARMMQDAQSGQYVRRCPAVVKALESIPRLFRHETCSTHL